MVLETDRCHVTIVGRLSSKMSVRSFSLMFPNVLLILFLMDCNKEDKFRR